MEEVDWLVPHQANLRIIEAVSSRAKFDSEKVLVNIQHYGNTSAASIPLCLDEYKHKLKKGDKIMMTAFGAGFTCGSCILYGLSIPEAGVESGYAKSSRGGGFLFPSTRFL